MKKDISKDDLTLNAVALLEEIVNWWDAWIISKNPTDLEDPPINEARAILARIAMKKLAS